MWSSGARTHATEGAASRNAWDSAAMRSRLSGGRLIAKKSRITDVWFVKFEGCVSESVGTCEGQHSLASLDTPRLIAMLSKAFDQHHHGAVCLRRQLKTRV